MDSHPIFSLRTAEVYQALESSPAGISSTEVPARQEMYGCNLLTEEAKPSPWGKIAGHLSHPLALLLWLAGAVTFFIGEPVLGLVIWALVLANAGFSFWREHRAEQAMQALRRLAADIYSGDPGRCGNPGCYRPGRTWGFARPG